MTRHVIAIAAFALLTAPALAVDLPAACTKDAPMGGMNMGAEPMAPAGDAAHRELMAGMAAMDEGMAAGGTAADIDVAFVCSMIPHHQGAIDMAKAELAHGDDPWAKEMAQRVIDAQTKEIADMLAWLGKQQ